MLHPTLSQTWSRVRPGTAMCVRKISAQCVLQFTPSLAAGCVLHRPVSRVIHCSELSFGFFLARGISAPFRNAFEIGSGNGALSPRYRGRTEDLRSTTSADPGPPADGGPPAPLGPGVGGAGSRRALSRRDAPCGSVHFKPEHRPPATGDRHPLSPLLGAAGEALSLGANDTLRSRRRRGDAVCVRVCFAGSSPVGGISLPAPPLPRRRSAVFCPIFFFREFVVHIDGTR